MIIPENQEERDKIQGFLDTQNASNLDSTNNKDTVTPGSQQEPTDTHKCNKCKKIVDQKVVNFCTHPTQQQKFGGRILCRECQKEETG